MVGELCATLNEWDILGQKEENSDIDADDTSYYDMNEEPGVLDEMIDRLTAEVDISTDEGKVQLGNVVDKYFRSIASRQQEIAGSNIDSDWQVVNAETTPEELEEKVKEDLD